MKSITTEDFSWLDKDAVEPAPKALQTFYNGYKFRSRLEARWAVFFDTLGIKYEYEREGYLLDNVGPYLPDFWLPQVKMWAEVKPESFSDIERQKCEMLAYETGYDVLMLSGPPDFGCYSAYARLSNDGAYQLYPDVEFVLDNTLLAQHEFPRVAPTVVGWHYTETYQAAVHRSRQARFEFGQRG